MELTLLLNGVYEQYGYDFRSYTQASIMRRVKNFMQDRGFLHISECIPSVLHDDEALSDFVQYISVPVSEMFRDPAVYRELRENIFPRLRTYPHIKIWSAGCATGEEAYSLAIMAVEEGLEQKVTIYGTDFNDKVLDTARKGIFNISRVKEFTQNYIQSGGKEEFSRYYHSAYNSVVMNDRLKKLIFFSNHNLVSDSAFGEMQLVLCRNVLIYLNHDLQVKVLHLLTESLNHRGFLCIGTHESLRFNSYSEFYSIIDEKKKIFQRDNYRGIGS